MSHKIAENNKREIINPSFARFLSPYLCNDETESDLTNINYPTLSLCPSMDYLNIYCHHDSDPLSRTTEKKEN